MSISNYSTLILAFILVTINPSCFTQVKKMEQGLVLQQKFYYDNEKKKFIKEPMLAVNTLWYWNNFVIQEVRGLSTQSFNGQITSIDTSVDHYTFYDFHKKMAFDFASFSVDAPIIRHYVWAEDSLIEGWNFQRSVALLGRDNLKKLSDTVIRGKQYKRLQTNKYFVTANDTIEHVKIGYIRTDITNSLFHLDKPLDDSLGSTMVRMDFWVFPKKIAMSSSFDFIRHQLTKNELLVFKALAAKTRIL